ncbi:MULTISPECIES: OmpA family protein [Rufibacter]|uniref:Outer membrane protein OmpA-like peptidoglycan-associated protein n=1 Tax=Rufibacter quisquiliarum TaxID=1549639 RepID=A0A839G9G6_9BACT|nr:MULTISPECIES: OmpA family protein [Rufibacter]MBA9076134.1 outer membrane protein OmpA-like peptidoglycan-associated protein [Rufibacter quisquiliarum]
MRENHTYLSPFEFETRALSVKTVFLLLVLLISCGLTSLVATAQTDTRQADKHFSDFEYALALEKYKDILEKSQPTLSLVERVAHCYRFMNQPKEAEFWYRQVLAFPEYPPANLFYLAEASKQNGDYVTAKQYYLQFAEREPARKTEALRLAKGCDWAMAWIDRPMAFEVKQEEALNSGYADFSPAFFQQGIVFSSDRVGAKDQKVYGWTGTPYLQLYYAPRKGENQWGEPKLLDKNINSEYHNATATFTGNFSEIFFTRTMQVKNKVLPEEVAGGSSWQKYSKNDKFINKLEIYSATLRNGKWQEAQPFPHNQAEQYSLGHPALSPDGQILYFVSDMPGGYGETDIYFSERVGGSWSKPVNAGPAVNTPGKEVFPVVDASGKLYFSSDGHIGMGGLDIFSAVGSKNEWKEISNLYYPFNSPRDDFGLIYEKDGKNGFFSSNRESDKGSDNIYRFEPKYIPCNLSGVTFVKVTDKKGRTEKTSVEGVKLTVSVKGPDSAQIIQVVSNKKGEFYFPVKANTVYTIKGSKRGYLNQTILVAPDCRKVTDTVEMEMVLNRSTPNIPIRIENIYYDLDKYDLRPEAILELDKVVAMLQDNPEVRIELSSHTDSRQSHRYNQMLSQMRAAAAVKYILSKGIAPKRIIAKGYGETKLLNRCKDGVSCSEEDHQLNRRTEFKILR